VLLRHRVAEINAHDGRFRRSYRKGGRRDSGVTAELKDSPLFADHVLTQLADVLAGRRHLMRVIDRRKELFPRHVIRTVVRASSP
jgi:hypothetical protein